LDRKDFLHHLADLIISQPSSHPLCVAIDEIDTTGKTTLANELTPLIEIRGRPVIRASIDKFHRPRVERYRQGPDSSKGYYEDSFNIESLSTVLLGPLGLEGNRRYRRAIFDFHTDGKRQEVLMLSLIC
jgi:uridine kinase